MPILALLLSGVFACGPPEQFRDYSLPALYAPSASGEVCSNEPVSLTRDDSLQLAGGIRLVRAERARPVADFLFRDVDGREHSPASLRGRVVLIELWSTWCATCRADFPMLQDLDERLRSEGLVVLAVCRDSAHEDYLHAVSKNWITFASVNAGKVESFPFPYGAFPTTVALDRRGCVRAYWQGHREPGAVEGMLRRLLAERAGDPVAPTTSPRQARLEDDSARVVSVTLELPTEELAAGELLEGKVVFDVAPGWHVVASGEGALPLVVAPEAGEELGALSTLPPPGHLVQFTGVERTVYAERFEIPLWGLVNGLGPHGGSAELRVLLTFQACDSTCCLLPANMTLSGELWLSGTEDSAP